MKSNIILASLLTLTLLSGCSPRNKEYPDFTPFSQELLNKAEQGDAAAQCAIGGAYFASLGVDKDYEEAMRWYAMAAKQGSAEGQFGLGVCHYFGMGVPKDDEEAIRWYTKAAEQGHAQSQSALGMLYYDGYNIPQDYNKSFEWYTKAARQGHAESMYYVSVCYAFGRGVSKDLVEAYAWAFLANQMGFPGEIDVLEKMITPSDIEQGHSRAKKIERKYKLKKYRTTIKPG
jgi:hypothetical protein